MTEVVIASAARTPIGKFGGGLSTVLAPQLGATAIRSAIERAKIGPEQVDYVIMGLVLSAGVGQAPARQAAIWAGIPATTSALGINKVCASGLTAVVLAAQAIRLGDAEIVVAGGMESMSLAPHFIKGSRTGIRMGDGELTDSMIHDGLWCPFEKRHMGVAAETIAAKYGISRTEQDEFALRSHRRAVAATKEGSFAAEIVPVEVVQRREKVLIDKDEGPRSDTSLEALSRIAPAFGADGTVTAGNASQISDGAAALVVMAAKKAKEIGIKPLARITGYAHSGIDPHWLFDAPVTAVERLLEKTGAHLDDFDLIESNEAFAAQVLANGKALGWDWERVNVKGGAVALGHPVGCSGARIVVTLLHTLKERQLKRGLAVVCHGGGGAVTMSVEMGSL